MWRVNPQITIGLIEFQLWCIVDNFNFNFLIFFGAE